MVHPIDHPLVGRADVEAAAARIRPWTRRTPIIEAEAAGARLVLKLEHLQHTGSFKARGAFNRLLVAEVPDAGVVVASGGNAGLAVAYAASRLGHRSIVFAPENAPAAKVERLRAWASEVRLVGRSYADALAVSGEHAERTGALAVHAYDQAEVVAGQGTLALELQEQAPHLDTLLVAVGGGGLIGGIAAANAGATRVVAVETTGCPTFHAALRAGTPVDVDVSGIAADALGARTIGEVCWSLRERIADAVLVEDDAVRAAQHLLWDEFRQLVEPGGAVALAALTSAAYRAVPGEVVGIVVCGANVGVAPPTNA